MNKSEFSFEFITQDDQARLCKMYTPRGVIETPVFMPVGTQGTVKGVFVDDLLKTETSIILGNTYHLLLRPGVQILNRKIEKLEKENDILENRVIELETELNLIKEHLNLN